VYKGTTIAKIEKETASSQVFSVRQSDDERVNLEDHKLEHIPEGRFKEKLKQLLANYEDVFCKSPKFMGKTNLIKYKIEVTEDKPD